MVTKFFLGQGLHCRALGIRDMKKNYYRIKRETGRYNNAQPLAVITENPALYQCGWAGQFDWWFFVFVISWKQKLNSVKDKRLTSLPVLNIVCKIKVFVSYLKSPQSSHSQQSSHSPVILFEIFISFPTVILFTTFILFIIIITFAWVISFITVLYVITKVSFATFI